MALKNSGICSVKPQQPKHFMRCFTIENLFFYADTYLSRHHRRQVSWTGSYEAQGHLSPPAITCTNKERPQKYTLAKSNTAQMDLKKHASVKPKGRSIHRVIHSHKRCQIKIIICNKIQNIKHRNLLIEESIHTWTGALNTVHAIQYPSS